MNKYILTWKRQDTWRKNGNCRCCFDTHSYYWQVMDNDPIIAFSSILTKHQVLLDYNFRLTCCGKLIARQATYTGV